MTDRPIIMTPENVRLLIREAEQPGAAKRETRRLLYVASAEAREPTLLDGYPPHTSALKGANWRPSGWHRTEPGDRLWVREACVARGPNYARYWARSADESRCPEPRMSERRRRASFHMPRVDSRLTLLVESVRIERLHDISEDDARAEGMFQDREKGDGLRWQPHERDAWHFLTARQAYRKVWERLHIPPSSWGDNPWVVAISFKPVLGNIDTLAAAA